MASHDNIPLVMKHSYDIFCNIRGKSREDFTEKFWDLIVLTASDEDQKTAFKLQVNAKLSRGELPKGVPYHVFSDPPGPKAGCGTSTMNVICILQEMYGEKLKDYRVLLLNCGGQSQRLPSSSILGKVFMALPMGSPALSLFEFKLFCFLPLIEKMAPGYIHVPADTIEVYDLGEDAQWTFERPGFTALAHPSSLFIGTTHGVFVLADKKEGMSGVTDMRQCKMVLQKPSVETMKNKGAIQVMDGNGKEFVYTDSNFYFDHAVAQKLAEFYKKEAPLNCEIDGYSDFLQALGPKATIDYTKDTRNIHQPDPRLTEIREKVFYLLKGTPLNIVAMNASKFYHLGTMREYIYHFCEDDVIAKQMNFSRQAFCTINAGNTKEQDVDGGLKRAKMESSIEGTLIQCSIQEDSVINKKALLEFCSFSSAVEVGGDCIISSCCMTDAGHPEKLVIPNETFMHTVAINSPDGHKDNTQYVTVAFHVDDNIKKSVERGCSEQLLYFNKPLSHFARASKLSFKRIIPDTAPSMNLWQAKLFPVCSTLSESFRMTHGLILALSKDEVFDLSGSCTVSMADILNYKNAKAMLDYRQELYDQILAT